MKSRLFILATPVVLLSISLTTPSASFADQELFIKSKCANCHALSAAGIEAKNKSPKNKAPDLSSVGKYFDSESLSAYLKKEAEHKPHEGCTGTKKHMLKFNGSDEELKTLSDWLVQQKQ